MCVGTRAPFCSLYFLISQPFIISQVSKIKQLKIKDQKIKNPKIKDPEIKDPKIKDPQIKDPMIKDQCHGTMVIMMPFKCSSPFLLACHVMFSFTIICFGLSWYVLIHYNFFRPVMVCPHSLQPSSSVSGELPCALSSEPTSP